MSHFQVLAPNQVFNMKNKAKKVAGAIVAVVFIVPGIIIFAFTRRLGLAMWPLFAGLYGLVAGLGKAFEAGFGGGTLLRTLEELRKEDQKEPNPKKKTDEE